MQFQVLIENGILEFTMKDYKSEIIIEILKCIDIGNNGNSRWRRINGVVKYSDILL